MDGIGLPLQWGIIPVERNRIVVPVPSPAAGADWSVAVPGGVLWDVLTAKARLVTAVAAGNRVAALEVTDGTTLLFGIGGVTNQAASLTIDYSWLQEYATNGINPTGGHVPNWLPEFPLHAGYVLRSATQGIQAADQWSAVVLLVDEFKVSGLRSAMERYEAALAAVGQVA